MIPTPEKTGCYWIHSEKWGRVIGFIYIPSDQKIHDIRVRFIESQYSYSWKDYAKVAQVNKIKWIGRESSHPGLQDIMDESSGSGYREGHFLEKKLAGKTIKGKIVDMDGTIWAKDGHLNVYINYLGYSTWHPDDCRIVFPEKQKNPLGQS